TYHRTGTPGGTYYVHNNHRGDIILVRRDTATVTRYEYSAFGNWQLEFGNDICRFKFSSKERDPSTGFYYYGYRYYAPGWQRWMSTDPIGEDGGLNLYAFGGNAPMKQLDPIGLSSYYNPWPYGKPPPVYECKPGGRLEPYWRVMDYESFWQCVHCEGYNPRDVLAGACGIIGGSMIGNVCTRHPLGVVIGGALGSVAGYLAIPVAICLMPICVYD
ncbi:MAG: hypothetical protein N2379_09635, partial [Verrucomicrobiae bacterium]|nr:hypothetical protein [Verrucomicrobiae bacterium]